MNNDKIYLNDRPVKKHKILRKKIIKRRENQKKVDDSKKEKKQKNKKLEEFAKTCSAEEQKLLKIYKHIKNYEEKFPKDLEDLIQVFKFVDNCDVIDTLDIENEESKQILEAIFDIFGLEPLNGVYQNRKMGQGYYKLMKGLAERGIDYIKSLRNPSKPTGDDSDGEEEVDYDFDDEE